MNPLTAEQIDKIFHYLYKQGAEQFFSATQMHNLEQAIKQHRAGTKILTFEQGESTIKMIEDAIAHSNALQKEKAKKAKAAEKKANKSKEDTAMKANQPTETVIIIEDGFDTNTNKSKEDTNMNQQQCSKCNGTGKYHTPLKDGSIGNCFACKGTGKTTFEPMTEAQIKFIRDLFKQVVNKMSEEKANNLVSIMKAHINGEKIQSKRWASAAIDQLKAIKAKGGRVINSNS